VFADRPVNKQQLAVPFEIAPAYGRRAWRFMTDVLVPDFIMPAVVEKFRESIDEWIHTHWPQLGLEDVELANSDGRVMLRRRGYTILPHRDPKWGFITCLLYLARPQDSDSWGTQLYEVEQDEEAHGDAPHWIDAAKCRQVADVSFRANRLLIFVNSYGAHGASIPADAEPADLERYMYQFRMGPSTAAIEKLMSLLPPDRRPLWAESGPS
jgi:hypothetical protein